MSERAVMSRRANDLATAFEQASDELIATLEGCSNEQLQAPCAGEGWPAIVTAHHVAVAYPEVFSMVRQIAHGEEIPPFTAEELDEVNAQHAQEHASVSREATVELLQREGAAVAAGIRALSDEQLDRSAALVVAGGQVVSAAQLIEMALIGHAQEHGASIKAAIAH